jgi:hypothetical protein
MPITPTTLFPCDRPGCENANEKARFRPINERAKPELTGKRCCAKRGCMEWGGWIDKEAQKAARMEKAAAERAEKEAAKQAKAAAKAPKARAAAPSAAARAQPLKLTCIHNIYGSCAFKPDGGGLDRDAFGDFEDVIGDDMPHYLVQCDVADGRGEEYTTLKWLAEDELIEVFKLNSGEHDRTLLNAVMKLNFELVSGLMARARESGLGGTRHCASDDNVEDALEQAMAHAIVAECDLGCDATAAQRALAASEVMGKLACAVARNETVAAAVAAFTGTAAGDGDVGAGAGTAAGTAAGMGAGTGTAAGMATNGAGAPEALAPVAASPGRASGSSSASARKRPAPATADAPAASSARTRSPRRKVPLRADECGGCGKPVAWDRAQHTSDPRHRCTACGHLVHSMPAVCTHEAGALLTSLIASDGTWYCSDACRARR